MATGTRNQQTGRAGEHFVAAELNRRGAYAVTFAGNMPRIDILASNFDQTRTISIQVKLVAQELGTRLLTMGKSVNLHPMRRVGYALDGT